MVYYSCGEIGVFDHEIAHTWGAGIGASLGLTEGGVHGQGHWNSLSDIPGQLGGSYFSEDGSRVGQFFDNGDGTWLLVDIQEQEPYSPLELYVMGLIPPEEVPPIHVLTSPDLTDPEHVTAASARTFTIAQIMAAEGDPRDPAYPDTQRDFTLAFIVTQDIPCNDAAYAFFSVLSAVLMTHQPPLHYTCFNPFYWATGGRATLNTRLPVDLPEPVFSLNAPPCTSPSPTATPAPVAPATVTEPAAEVPASTRRALPCLSAALPEARDALLLTRRTRRPS